MRKKQALYIIPAHDSIISQVKYESSEGYFLVTASYDNTARIWSPRDFKPVKTLAGNEGKVMDVDVMEDGQYIAIVSSDRTIKLWSLQFLSKDMNFLFESSAKSEAELPRRWVL